MTCLSRCTHERTEVSMVVSGDSQVHDAVCAVHVEVVFDWKVFGVDQTRVANFNLDRCRRSSHRIALIHHQDLESDIRRVGPDDIQNILREVPLRNGWTENTYILYEYHISR